MDIKQTLRLRARIKKALVETKALERQLQDIEHTIQVSKPSSASDVDIDMLDDMADVMTSDIAGVESALSELDAILEKLSKNSA